MAKDNSVGMSEPLSDGGPDIAKDKTGMKELQYIGSALLLYEVVPGSRWIFEGRLIEHESGMQNMRTRD